ncbi:MAG: acyl-ACP--UDP-N-acetylglucosamine O-acyltransferase [Myxococcota bacterium]
MPRVHPTAIVEGGATLADDVEVGAYSFVGADVVLGAGVRVDPHAVVTGHTRVGEGTRIFSFACVGGEPQDKTFDGGPTRLEIGRDNVIREHVTIHVGTSRGGGCTRTGDDNMIMNGAHIAHDCQIGSHCIIASFTGLAGHVTVGDHAVLGAYTGVHQFSRVGESVMAASNAKLSQDAPPFSMVAGDRARLVGVNSVGLRRRGLEPEAIRKIKHAFHILFNSRLRLEPALARVRDEVSGSPEVERLLTFLEKSERGFCR